MIDICGSDTNSDGDDTDNVGHDTDNILIMIINGVNGTDSGGWLYW